MAAGVGAVGDGATVQAQSDSKALTVSAANENFTRVNDDNALAAQKKALALKAASQPPALQ